MLMLVGRSRRVPPSSFLIHPLWRLALCLHLCFLSRHLGSEPERYGDLSTILLLGGEESRESEFLKLNPNFGKPHEQALSVLGGSHPGIGWSHRKNAWDFAPSLTLKSLCAWISHQTSASMQARGGSASLGGPSWLCVCCWGPLFPIFLPTHFF